LESRRSWRRNLFAALLTTLVFAGLVEGAAAPASASAACVPDAPVQIAPSAGYVYSARPVFRWQAVPGATSYTLYVQMGDSDVILYRAAGLTGTASQPPTDLPLNVLVRWKVKAENGCGAGPYSPITYFTVAPPGPCPPSDAPEAWYPEGWIDSDSPRFEWSGVPGATSYTLYVIRVADEGTQVRVTNLTNTWYQASGLPHGVDLRWKVKAESPCGPGPYSRHVYFTVF
jgi:hypothetical protein